MSLERNIHIVPSGGNWARVLEGSDKPAAVYKTQKEAIAKAREIAFKNKVALVIHGKDGRIRDYSSYGRTVLPAPKTGKISRAKIRRAAKRAKRRSPA